MLFMPFLAFTRGCVFSPQANEIPYFEQCARINSPDASMPFWGQFRQVIESNNIVRVMVLGGSETAGVECEEGLLKHKSCAWSARVVHALQGMWPEKTFLLENLASGGSTMSVALPMVGTWLSSSPDIVLVDYIVNDAWEAQRDSVSGHSISSLYESFISKCAEMGTLRKVAFVNTCATSKCADTRDTIKNVAFLHSVALFNYAGVAECASFMSAADLTSSFWINDGGNSDVTHPNAHIHKLMGYFISNSIAEGLGCKESAPLAFSSSSQLSELEFCTTPYTLINAASPPHAQFVAVEWSLMEDRPGKAGWIATSSASRIEFPITFGPSGMLTVTWLKSYSGLGNCDMTLNGRTFLLKGLYDPEDSAYGSQISQSFMHTFLAFHQLLQDYGLSGAVGFGVLPNSNHTLVFETKPELAVDGVSKFKIISISTC